jgi:hypothetical protein
MRVHHAVVDAGGGSAGFGRPVFTILCPRWQKIGTERGECVNLQRKPAQLRHYNLHFQGLISCRGPSAQQ